MTPESIIFWAYLYISLIYEKAKGTINTINPIISIYIPVDVIQSNVLLLLYHEENVLIIKLYVYMKNDCLGRMPIDLDDDRVAIVAI